MGRGAEDVAVYKVRWGRGSLREGESTSKREAVAAAVMHCMSKLIPGFVCSAYTTPCPLPIHSGFNRLRSQRFRSVAHPVALPFFSTPLASQIPPVEAHPLPSILWGGAASSQRAWPPCLPLLHFCKHLRAHPPASHARRASVQSPAGSAGATCLGSSDLRPR